MGRFMGLTSAQSFSSEGEPMPSPRKLDLQCRPFVWGRAPSPVRVGTAACGHSNPGFAIVLVVLLCGLMVSSPGKLFAQSSSAGQNPSGEPEGVNSGGYLIHSSG